MSLTDFFTDVHERRKQQLLKRANQYPRNNPVASDISPCARETALGILHWQERPEFTPELLARFEVGNDQENLANAKMLNLGIKLVEQQSSFELKDTQGRVILRGRIDGKVEIEGRRIPFDYKTVNPMVFNNLNTVDDMLRHRFFSKYPKQIMAYSYMNDIDTGFLWLDNMLGQWKFIEVPMDWQLMEQILKQIESAVNAVDKVRHGMDEEKALPVFHSDPSVCVRCWARGNICNPPFFAQGEGLKVINDPEFSDKLVRRAQLDPMATEYDRLDKDIKEAFKVAMKPGDNWIIGDYLVVAEEKVRNMKPQPAKAGSTQKYMSFDIERVTEDEAIKKSDEDFIGHLNRGE